MKLRMKRVRSIFPCFLPPPFSSREKLTSSVSLFPPFSPPPALVQRAHFKEKRGRHYSNEAEAMKRAQALIAAGDDEDEEEEERQRQIEEARVKGNTELNAANGGARRNGRVAPPVPAIPNGFRQ